MCSDGSAGLGVEVVVVGSEWTAAAAVRIRAAVHSVGVRVSVGSFQAIRHGGKVARGLPGAL